MARAQVANKLGDRRTPHLAEALASRIRQTKWDKDADSDHMQHILKSLSTDLQHMVLKGASGNSGQAALDEWPLAVQHVRNFLRPSASRTTQIVDSCMARAVTKEPLCFCSACMYSVLARTRSQSMSWVIHYIVHLSKARISHPCNDCVLHDK